MIFSLLKKDLKDLVMFGNPFFIIKIPTYQDPNSNWFHPTAGLGMRRLFSFERRPTFQSCNCYLHTLKTIQMLLEKTIYARLDHIIYQKYIFPIKKKSSVRILIVNVALQNIHTFK